MADRLKKPLVKATRGKKAKGDRKGNRRRKRKD
jgi:hypothetical protein